jgi:hypothetical protein
VPIVVARAQPLDWWLHQRNPGVVLLPADEFPAVEGVGVAPAAVFEVMQVVRDDVRIDAAGAEKARERVVERLERAPGAVHEVEPSGVEIPAGRHARQTADIVGVEDNGARGEAVEVRRRDRVSAVTAKCVAVERVPQGEDEAHA